MPMRHTKDSESSSLPTPTTQDSSGQCRDHGGDLLHEVICGCPRSERKEALLRTPIAGEAEGGAVSPEVAKAKNQTLRLSGQMIDLVAPDQLPKLPTPTTRDYKDGSEPHERDGKVQTDTVARAVLNSGEVILPTPTTNGNDRKGPNYSSAGILQALEIANGILPKEYTDWEHARQKIKWAESVEGQDKKTLDSEISWGKFGPAIQLWEKHIGRKSPAPTKPDGKQGNHRLSSKFTEWMMGLPEGWITDVGLSRNEELKLAGNGVVPQQAELALRLLLENNERED
jgi:hypothetical protein